MPPKVILKASRPAATEKNDLTGRENLKHVEVNRIYNYGYKYFLYIEKIREIFGERIANSKKIRKAKIREILKKIMRTFNLQEDFPESANVDDFIRKTESKLREHVAEIHAMKSSSPIGTTAVSIKSKIQKRKKEASSQDADMMVVNTSPKKEIDPLENQIDFLAEFMKSTIDPSKKSTVTVRQVEAKFKDALKRDQDAIKKDLMEKERHKKAEKRRRMMELNREVRDDLTILFERTGI